MGKLSEEHQKIFNAVTGAMEDLASVEGGRPSVIDIAVSLGYTSGVWQGLMTKIRKEGHTAQLRIYEDVLARTRAPVKPRHAGAAPIQALPEPKRFVVAKDKEEPKVSVVVEDEDEPQDRPLFEPEPPPRLKRALAPDYIRLYDDVQIAMNEHNLKEESACVKIDVDYGEYLLAKTKVAEDEVKRKKAQEEKMVAQHPKAQAYGVAVKKAFEEVIAGGGSFPQKPAPQDEPVRERAVEPLAMPYLDRTIRAIDDETKVLFEVILLLKPLPPETRAKILSTCEVYLS